MEGIMESIMIWIWLIAIVAFGMVEAFTAGLVSLWFVFGALAGLVAALLGAGQGVQIGAFFLVSAVALAVTRPLWRKLRGKTVIPTNLDRAIGQIGKVTEAVDNENATGAVYVDGKTWSARSVHGEALAPGERVRIVKIEGVKLFVEKTEQLEGNELCLASDQSQLSS